MSGGSGSRCDVSFVAVIAGLARAALGLGRSLFLGVGLAADCRRQHVERNPLFVGLLFVVRMRSSVSSATIPAVAPCRPLTALAALRTVFAFVTLTALRSLFALVSLAAILLLLVGRSLGELLAALVLVRGIIAALRTLKPIPNVVPAPNILIK